jgi:hypothetical protein
MAPPDLAASPRLRLWRPVSLSSTARQDGKRLALPVAVTPQNVIQSSPLLVWQLADR